MGICIYFNFIYGFLIYCFEDVIIFICQEIEYIYVFKVEVKIGYLFYI